MGRAFWILFDAALDAICLMMMVVGIAMIAGKLWAIHYDVKSVDTVTFWSVEYNDGTKAGPLVDLEEKLHGRGSQ
jgi:hypothetical protein